MAPSTETCPLCGRPTNGHDRVRAWPGKWAHRDCASYSRRRPRRGAGSHRVHGKFTRT